MIITIKNDDGESVYDVSKIEDEQKKAGANITISKIGTLNVLVEALNFASRGHTIKQMDEGSAVVIKRKVNGPNGMVRVAPRLLDQNKQEVNLAVGNGSKVRVQYNEYDWEYAGKKGKGLDLQAVQIVDLVEYKSQDGSEFFDEDEEF